jgi:hypothetical protein
MWGKAHELHPSALLQNLSPSIAKFFLVSDWIIGHQSPRFVAYNQANKRLCTGEGEGKTREIIQPRFIELIEAVH